MSRESQSCSVRRESILEFYGRDGPGEGFEHVPAHSTAYLELPALHFREQGETTSFDSSNVTSTIEHVTAQNDCADFGLNALLPMVLRFGTSGSGVLPESLEAAIDEALRSSVYWFDEPGVHDQWFSTENHQVLWHTAELLAGQRHPDTRFRDGRTGTQHHAHAEAHLRRWLNWRIRFGFSEWLSDPYYDEDLTALANLAAFAADTEIAQQARDLVHLMAFDVVLNSHRGVFGCSHGRTYAPELLDPRRSSLGQLTFLLVGEGASSYRLSRAAILLALDGYEPPPVIETIHADLREWRGEYTQHHGLSVERAPEFGLDPATTDDQLYFWGALAMGHRDVVDAAMATITGSYQRRLREIAPAAAYHQNPAAHATYEPDPNNTAMTGADIYSYRTPAYLLSCAQDYRKGKLGFQQHVWQATIGDGVPIFTNHPREKTGLASWSGNGVLPRAAATQNLLVCSYDFEPGVLPYDIPDVPGWGTSGADVGFTHAFFPRDACDDFVCSATQVCARFGEAYVSLHTTTPSSWTSPDDEVTQLLPYADDQPYELVADGGQTTWVLELGDDSEYESFDEFVETYRDAALERTNGSIQYESPSRGTVTFGWEAPLTVDGDEVELEGYSRLSTPYCTTSLGTGRYDIRCGGASLTLDFDGS